MVIVHTERLLENVYTTTRPWTQSRAKLCWLVGFCTHPPQWGSFLPLYHCLINGQQGLCPSLSAITVWRIHAKDDSDLYMSLNISQQQQALWDCYKNNSETESTPLVHSSFGIFHVSRYLIVEILPTTTHAPVPQRFAYRFLIRQHPGTKQSHVFFQCFHFTFGTSSG